MTIAQRAKAAFDLPDPYTEETRRHAKVFLIAWSVAIAGLAAFAAYYAFATRDARFAAMLVLAAAVLASLFAYKRASPNSGAILLCWSMAAGLILFALAYGGLRDPSLDALPCVFIIAAMLLRRRSLIALSIVGFLSIASLGLLQLFRAVELPEADPIAPSDLFDTLVIQAATMTLVVFLSSVLQESLRMVKSGLGKISESEGRFREVLENSLDSSYKRDLLTNTYEYLSPVFERISGYGPEEFKTFHTNAVLELFHPDDRATVEGVIARSMDAEAGSTFRCEYRFKHKDGGYRWFLDRFVVVRDAAGKATAWIGSVSDITERKRIEEELRASEARFRAIVENSNDGILFGDADAKIRYRSPSYKRINGYSDEERIGHSGFETVYPEDAGRVASYWKGLVEGSIRDEAIEYRIRHRDGSWRWIETTGKNLLQHPDIRSIMIASRDVTERKRAEAALSESRALIDAIMNSTPDWIWSVGVKDFELLTFNEGLRRYFKQRRGMDIRVGQGPDALLPTRETGQAWRDMYARALSEGEYSTEYSVVAGTNILSLTFTPLTRDGEPYAISVFAQDVTERKLAELELKRSLAEKETLLRELYHRTKNNMNMIISLLEMQARSNREKSLREAFSVAQNRILSMSLVHEKLYEARDLCYVDLRDYIRDLVPALAESLGIGRDRIAIECDLEEARLLIDSAIPCGLVLNELVTNAFKHAFPGGRRGRVRVALRQAADGMIHLEVEDDGVGLPAGFEPRRDGGLGIGNVFVLVEQQLGGEVFVDSARGLRWRIAFKDDKYSPRI